MAKTHCPARNEPGDSLAVGVWARRRVVCGRSPTLAPQHIWAKHLRVWRESPVGQSTRKDSGWAVGWVVSKSGSRISRADKRVPQGYLGGPPGRHPGGFAVWHNEGLWLEAAKAKAQVRMWVSLWDSPTFAVTSGQPPGFRARNHRRPVHGCYLLVDIQRSPRNASGRQAAPRCRLIPLSKFSYSLLRSFAELRGEHSRVFETARCCPA